MDSWQLFVRHAHRDTGNPRLDNGLSTQGREQCLNLVKFLEKNYPERKPEQILSSPKRRCLETAEALSKWSQVPVEVDSRLDEQFENERDFDFLNRLRSFFYDNEVKSRICIVSHGDVLPLFARLAGYSIEEPSKGNIFWIENKILRGVNEVATSKRQ